jgi:hypothetical protein
VKGEGWDGRGARLHAGTRRATRAEETIEAEEDYEGNDRRGKKHDAGTGRETDQETFTFTLGSQHTGSRRRDSTSMVAWWAEAMEWVRSSIAHYPPKTQFDVETRRWAVLAEQCWRASR